MEPEHAPQQRFLTDVILELGFTTSEKISEAIESARLTNKTAEQLLIENGHVTEQQLGHALAVRYETEYVNLEAYPVDMEAAGQVTRTVARRCGVVPVAFDGPDALIVALFDSAGVAAAGDVAALTRMAVHPLIASREQVEALIEQLPEREMMRPGRERRQAAHDQALAAESLEARKHQASQAAPPAEERQPSPPVQPAAASQASPEKLSNDLLERVSQLADPARNIDLSPELRLVEGAEAGASEDQNREQLRAELDRLVTLEQELRTALGHVGERMKEAGALPGSNERIAELEKQLAAAEAARDEAEAERDELRRRLAAIRETLGQ